jgi:hypothetical protein
MSLPASIAWRWNTASATGSAAIEFMTLDADSRVSFAVGNDVLPSGQGS